MCFPLQPPWGPLCFNIFTQSHLSYLPFGVNFLKSELARLKTLRRTDPRAVILAVHHPTVSVDSHHAGSTGIQTDLDNCCKAAGLWPDMVLHGHAHLYQRFTRNLPGGAQIPYLISGSGGFAATAPKGPISKVPLTVGDHTLEIEPIIDFGYLTLETDGKTYLSAAFKIADKTKGVVQMDAVKVDLAAGKLALSSTRGRSPAPRTAVAKKTILKRGAGAAKGGKAKKR